MTATMTRPRPSGYDYGEGSAIRDELAERAKYRTVLFDPDLLVRRIHAARVRQGYLADIDQTRQYVLHVVRNAPHVCRHQFVRGVYRMHEAAECSPACKAAYDRERKAGAAKLTCGDCFTVVTPCGTCLCDG